MPVHYSPLPPNEPDAQRELEDAFESDNDEEHEQTPLTRPTVVTVPGTYDFERDYDMIPPPGNPPSPTQFARPNDIGNSNGLLPQSPVGPSQPRPSFFRRIVGTVLPTHYQYDSVPNVESFNRTRGSGTNNDGVFANVTAKPTRATVVRTENGEVHLVPEDSQKEAPPSYAAAQLDAAPPYMSTIHVPPSLDLGADMIIEDMPAGSVWSFFINLFISFFFQFVGFLLCFLLHTSHSGKYGARAGLGLTLIQYGFYSRATNSEDPTPPATDSFPWVNSTDPSVVESYDVQVVPSASASSRDWLSFLLMTLGWFLFLSSCVGFWRVKRWERSIRSTTTPAPITREDIENDIAVRRNLESVFGIPMDDPATQNGENGHVIVIPAPELLEEERLARDLRAAGLL